MSVKDLNQEIKSIFSSALTFMKKSHSMQVIIAERVLSSEFWFSSDIFTFQQYLPALFPWLTPFNLSSIEALHMPNFWALSPPGYRPHFLNSQQFINCNF
jgi:hypothetical protein